MNRCVTVAVEPEMLKDLNKLEEALEEIKIEDPNITVEISSETGECLVSGLGPLHLETIASAIKERGINVTTSKPTSVFRESVLHASEFIEKKSPNGLNRIILSLKPLEKETVRYLRSMKSSILEQRSLRETEIPEHTGLSIFDARGIWNLDDHQNLLISHLRGDAGMEFDSNDQPVEGTEINMIEVSESQEKPSKSGKKRSAKLAKESEKENLSNADSISSISPEIRKDIIKNIQSYCMHGPLAQEPLIELMIIVKDLQIAPNKEDANYFELSTMLSQALMECLTQAEPVLLEPIYKVLINSPQEYIGNVSSLVSQHQGKIRSMTQDPFRMHIEAEMAVRYSIDFSQEIRSETSGRVFWQSTFDSFQRVPEHQQSSIISDIRFRKGLRF